MGPSFILGPSALAAAIFIDYCSFARRNGRLGARYRRTGSFGASRGPAALLLTVRHGRELSGLVGLSTSEGRSDRLALGDTPSAALHRPYRQHRNGRLPTFYSQTLVAVARMSHVSFASILDVP